MLYGTGSGGAATRYIESAMSERVLGRGAELQQVAALLADDTPQTRALVLTGDAGVGKTTIWERASGRPPGPTNGP